MKDDTRALCPSDAGRLVLTVEARSSTCPVGAGYPAAGRGAILPDGPSNSVPLIGVVTMSR